MESNDNPEIPDGEGHKKSPAPLRANRMEEFKGGF